MPGPVQRTAEEQQQVDKETADLALYHYATCGFSLRVRSVMQALGLNIELCDIYQDNNNLEALVSGGGRSTVPCLRIGPDDDEAEWMYESADIMRFLVTRFAPEELQ